MLSLDLLHGFIVHSLNGLLETTLDIIVTAEWMWSEMRFLNYLPLRFPVDFQQNPYYLSYSCTLDFQKCFLIFFDLITLLFTKK